MYRKQVLLEKLREAAASVLPISLIVLAICFVLVPVDTGLMLSFMLATAMLILGMGLFTLGAEMSMSKIGNYMGAQTRADFDHQLLAGRRHYGGRA